MIETRDQLHADVMQADASMLLEYMRERTALGDVRAITTREALEAIHRRQGDTLNPHDAAHVGRVMKAIAAMLISGEEPRI